jgi:elongation factor Tu
LGHSISATYLPCGYRPQFFYDDRDWDATHDYLGREWVQPGEKVLARLTFASRQHQAGRVHVGMPILIREGAKTVGYGVVTSLIDLEPSATKRDAGHHFRARGTRCPLRCRPRLAPRQNAMTDPTGGTR